MIPSDPRTWTDFSNPGQHGFEKIDRDTTLERAFVAVAVACGIAAGVILLSLVASQRPPFISGDMARVVVPGLAVLAGLSLGLRWMTNNYYLVDPSRHAVFYHFQSLVFRSVRLLLEGKDIVATSVEARRRRSKHRSWWEHRAVLIGADGRIVPMSNWHRDDVWAANNIARDLAKQLDCPSHEAAEESRLVVKVEHGSTSVSFEPYASRMRHPVVQVVVVVFVFVVLGLVWFGGWR